MTVLAGHQPNYLPWIGFFDKMAKSDIFILHEAVQFNGRDYVNRNFISVDGHPVRLTVPVKNGGTQVIRDVEIDYHRDWMGKHRRQIEAAYGRAPYFSSIKSNLLPYYSTTKPKYFANFSESLIFALAKMLNIKTEIIVVSDDRYLGKDSIVTLCKDFGADTYLSGQGGKSYMDKVPLAENGIKLEYQEIKAFTNSFSVIDLIAVSNLYYLKSEGWCRNIQGGTKSDRPE